MKYVIVDLEMNPVSNEYPNERKVSRLETIQIGAVLLDEKYQEIGSFVTLVKPEYNTRIQKRYEKLTGIKTSMVESAPHFKEALGMFFNWCGSIQDEVQIIQWSENELPSIYKRIADERNFSIRTESKVHGTCLVGFSGGI